MIFTAKASAATLAYDGFDYPSGTGLNGRTGGFGWNVVHPEWTTGQVPPASTITAPGLPLPTAIGNAFTTHAPSVATRHLDADRFNVLNFFGNIGDVGTDLWFSFLVQDHFTASARQVWGGLRLFPGSMDNTANNLFVGKLVDPVSAEHHWGLGWHVNNVGANAIVSQNAPAAVQANETYLLVVHFTSSAASEQLSLYVNPVTPDIAPAAPDAQITLAPGQFVFQSVDFETGQTEGHFTFDELTFGTDYKSVALTSDAGPRLDPVPEPTIGAMLLGTVGLGAGLRRRRSGGWRKVQG